jgi:hypothetical protein
LAELSKRLIIGVNDLASQRPTLAIEWHSSLNGDLTPQMITVSNDREVWWEHTTESGFFHEWSAKINNRSRIKNPKGCPFCSGKRVQIGFNDLNTINPILASEWHYILNGNLTPQMVTVSSHKEVWWEHTTKSGFFHEWSAKLTNRSHKTRPRGCPFCSGQRIQLGFNDLATISPTLALEWHSTKNNNVTPQMITISSGLYIWWEHTTENGFHHEWQAYPGARSNRNPTGCPFCSGHRVQVGFNDLGTLNPSLTLEWHPILNGNLTPGMVTLGSHKDIWWQCPKTECGYIWETTVKSRAGYSKSNCPECARTYFDSTKPAHLYVITASLKGHQVIQFGISNKVKVRLRAHYRTGFTASPIALIPFASGQEAQQVENMLKRLMREKAIPTRTTQGIKFDGSTEAFRIEDATASFLTSFEQLVG